MFLSLLFQLRAPPTQHDKSVWEGAIDVRRLEVGGDEQGEEEDEDGII